MSHALPILLLALLLAPAGSCQSVPDPPAGAATERPAPAAEPAGFAPGDAVQISWGGSWWNGRILEAGPQGFKVTYDGYDAGYDEWVGAERLRGLQPPAPSPAGAGAGAEALIGTWQYESWLARQPGGARSEMMTGDAYYWLTLRANGSWTLSSTTRFAPSSPEFINWGQFSIEGGQLVLRESGAGSRVHERHRMVMEGADTLVLTETSTGDVIRLRRGRG